MQTTHLIYRTECLFGPKVKKNYKRWEQLRELRENTKLARGVSGIQHGDAFRVSKLFYVQIRLLIINYQTY